MSNCEYITELQNKQVKCTLCNDIILNIDRYLLEAHLHDKKHKELYMKSLMTTNNIVIGTVDLFCYICNHNIPISDLMRHVQSSNHQIKYTSIKQLVSCDGDFINLPQMKSANSSAYCMLCDRSVELMYNSLEKHIKCSTHREVKAMVLQPLNGIFSVEKHDEYLWCKICQKFFDNYIEVIFQHVSDGYHATHMAKISRLINGQNIIIEKYLQDLKEDKVYCDTCKLEVPCSIDNLQSHIKGKKHLKNLQERKIL